MKQIGVRILNQFSYKVGGYPVLNLGRIPDDRPDTGYLAENHETFYILTTVLDIQYLVINVPWLRSVSLSHFQSWER